MGRNARQVREELVGWKSQCLLSKRRAVVERATCKIREVFCLPFGKEGTEKYGEFTQGTIAQDRLTFVHTVRVRKL